MNRVGSVLLTVGAVLGTASLLVALAGLVLDVKPLVFRSGSMGPDIPAGSFGLARPVPAADLAVGDVVSVIAGDGTRVTHRIVAVDGSGATRELTLRGDANPVADPETYPVRRADRLVWSVPYAGHVVAFLGRPLGLFLLGALVLALLVVIFRRDRPRGGKHRAAKGVATGTAAVLAVVASGAGASAYFSDTATATSGTVAAHTVVSPTAASCQAGVLGLLSASVSWPGDPRYDYEVVLRRASNGSVVRTDQVTGSASSHTYSVLEGGLAIAIDYQVEIRAYLADAPTWRAATAHVYQYIRVTLVLASCTNTSGT